MTEEQTEKLQRELLQQKITIGQLLIENANLRLALMEKKNDGKGGEGQ